ncbi:Mfa1 family fimbria major subunit [uncultured Bacteroides sp.]|uniref:Mfa1 family fimbria major subunit n=1 Tax=uncultured Bacteroides sp. TaxID=162156 RepID=UPI002609F90E|nr:Mfa1 family fimbria major subunit [uncultured Bacteroides sp.]
MKTNLKNMAWMLAATLVMAACSDSLDESENTGQGPLTGEGYVKVAINMPSVSSTRAFDETNDLNDGIEKEWTVKNGIIAFFEGKDKDVEGEAKFVKAYDLGTMTDNSTTNNNHVSNIPYAKTLNAPVLSDGNTQMYALVILNNGENNSLASVDNEGKRLTLKNGDAPIILESGTSTFKDLDGAKWALNSDEVTSNGFLMLNAPLYDNVSKKAQTLVPVKVYPTKEEAEQYSVNIYVERIVAKVDVSIPDLAQIGTDSKKEGLAVKKNTVYTGDQVVFVDKNDGAESLGWVLNVTNKNTKPLRNVSGIADWLDNTKFTELEGRDFIGTTSVEGNWKRIYWAIDNNYDGNSTDTDFNIYRSHSEGSSLPAKWKAYSESTTAGIVPQYCLENTAPAADMKENNTTCVLIKAIYLVDGIDAEDKSFFMIGDNAVTLSKAEFLSKIKTDLGIPDDAGITLDINSTAAGGYYKGASKLKELISGLEGSDTTYDDALNDLGEVRYYKDGGCYYYSVPIQHFEIEQPKGQAVTDANFLGGYGVVRNNWYQIQINSVSGPGEPGVDPGEEPIVKDEGYLNCTINVLSWAKRSQGVEL